jgi:DUF1365 family protein
VTGSALYEGSTRHRRFVPTLHEFRFRLFLVLLDHDELRADPTLIRPKGALGRSFWPALRFERTDYLDGDGETDLGDAVRDLVTDRTGVVPAGRILTLTQMRTNGYVFNPITVHYCLSPESADDGSPRIDVAVLEVTNTPWNERTWYVVDARVGAGSIPERSVSVAATDERGRIRSEFPKTLHVSPFMAMDMTYRFTATPPDDRLWLRLENLDMRHDHVEKIFDADLSLVRSGLATDNIRSQVRRHPFQTIRVWLAIHTHALRLMVKRVPFVPHPDRSRSGTASRPHDQDLP